jgi:hypothetical protein
MSGAGTNRRFILIRDLVSQTWFKTLNLDGEPTNPRIPLASFVGLMWNSGCLISVGEGYDTGYGCINNILQSRVDR